MGCVVISAVGAMVWKSKDGMPFNIEDNTLSTECYGVDGILNSFIDTQFRSTRDELQTTSGQRLPVVLIVWKSV